MRKCVNLFVATLIVCGLYSFTNFSPAEPPSGAIYYQFKHMRDTTNTSRIWREDFVLVFNSQKSLYSSRTKQIQDSAHQAALEAAMKANSEVINLGVFMPTTGEKIQLSEEANNVLVQRTFQHTNYQIKESLEKIDWKIMPATKEIHGYTCQQAIGACKGRIYTAWFTTDIPASFGPWKLHGLPGLILEAYDTDKRIHFTCTNILLGNSLPKNATVELPSDAVATTYNEYNRMEKTYRDGMSANTSFSNDDATVEKITVNGSSAMPNKKQPTINYPLELTN
ncbi:GLPGLI family protein [Chitinophaga skermanii]|uniref:GLPGLI family protein n=1 Tax=Chitinophaga skermanii TaxID=331697 RepID=A0A327QDF9_9BACT|nr:GLPGLI family protein [Chitinophaga skermanii]RAJ02341.1 GLPGLI family protein [Chitinophaga skermanii]